MTEETPTPTARIKRIEVVGLFVTTHDGRRLPLHEFQGSPLHRGIRTWEARNPPYLVLAPPDQATP